MLTTAVLLELMVSTAFLLGLVVSISLTLPSWAAVCVLPHRQQTELHVQWLFMHMSIQCTLIECDSG